MSEHTDAEAASAAARQLLAAGHPAGALLRDHGKIGQTLAIRDRGGDLRFWFVPVLAGEQIAGYFRIEADLSDWRWSSFQRRPDTLAGCPPAALWLDAEAIRQRALVQAHPGEMATVPRLSYDRVPDRLAWIVRLQTPAGDGRDLFVAGHAVWEATADLAPDSTDGGGTAA